MKNLHQNKNYKKYSYSINKAYKKYDNFCRNYGHIKLACTNSAGILFYCIPCLKMLYELQAPSIRGGGGTKWNKNKNLNKEIEISGVQLPHGLGFSLFWFLQFVFVFCHKIFLHEPAPPPFRLKTTGTCLNYSYKNENFMLV